MENTINFVGITPDNFLNELVSRVKTALLNDLQQSYKDNEPNRYYTAEQICERFSITKPTIHEYRKRNIIKSYKLGSHEYYRLDEIENAMIIND